MRICTICGGLCDDYEPNMHTTCLDGICKKSREFTDMLEKIMKAADKFKDDIMLEKLKEKGIVKE
jgi:formylmethanofuran dehydrogenase subunit B